MATKNVAAKAAPKAEAEKLTAGQKAAATKKANAAVSASSDESNPSPAKEVQTKSTPKSSPIKLVKPSAKEVADVKPAPPKAAKAAVAKAQPAVEVESTDAVGRKQLSEDIRALMQEHGIGVSSKVTLALVECFEQSVTDALSHGKDVVLPGFGKFKVAVRAGGSRRNPSNGEMIDVAPAWAVSFKVGKALKTSANNRPTV